MISSQSVCHWRWLSSLNFLSSIPWRWCKYVSNSEAYIYVNQERCPYMAIYEGVPDRYFDGKLVYSSEPHLYFQIFDTNLRWHESFERIRFLLWCSHTRNVKRMNAIFPRWQYRWLWSKIWSCVRVKKKHGWDLDVTAIPMVPFTLWFFTLNKAISACVSKQIFLTFIISYDDVCDRVLLNFVTCRNAERSAMSKAPCGRLFVARLTFGAVAPIVFSLFLWRCRTLRLRALQVFLLRGLMSGSQIGALVS